MKGQVLGVDALTTGYSLLMYRLLEHNGLPQGSYKLERLGGTTPRVQALTQGKIAGTMVSSPQEILPEQNGFKRLGDIQADARQLSGALRRRPPLLGRARIADELERYIRAYVAANDWLADPANRDGGRRHLRAAHSELTAAGDRQGMGRDASRNWKASSSMRNSIRSAPRPRSISGRNMACPKRN